MLLDGVGRIAVLRANKLGDFLLALPALEALRAGYPGAEIVLLGCDWHAGLLRSRPGPVDRVVPVPPTRGVRESRPEDPAEVAGFVAALRAERFDVAIQMHGGGRWSNPPVARLGARTTDAPPLDRSLPYAWYQPEVSCAISTGRPGGGPPRPALPARRVLGGGGGRRTRAHRRPSTSSPPSRGASRSRSGSGPPDPSPR